MHVQLNVLHEWYCLRTMCVRLNLELRLRHGMYLHEHKSDMEDKQHVLMCHNQPGHLTKWQLSQLPLDCKCGCRQWHMQLHFWNRHLLQYE